MKIGVCVSHAQEDIRKAFQNVKELGLDNCQLLSWNPALWTDEQADLIKDALKETGVEITAFWCGWTGPQAWNFYDGQETLGLVPTAYRFHRVRELMMGSDFAKKLGIEDVVTHMGFIPENPLDSNYQGLIVAIRSVAQHCKNNGQHLLFETGQETPVTLLRAIQDIGTDNLGVNLDPANLVLYGKANPVDAMETIGKYVRGVHGKDGKYPTDGHNLGQETPIGQGRVDFEKLIRLLAENGYDGSITIEREITGDEQTRDILAGKKYLENIITNL